MNWIRRLIRRQRWERQLDAELRFHLQSQVEDYLRAGMSEAEARRKARIEFGGLEQAKEECREANATAFVDAIVQDTGFAWRGFRRNPRFALSAIVAIALAVGAATAVFSVVDVNLFRPLPYAFGTRLVSIGIVAPVITSQDWLFAGTYQQWRRSQSVLESMAAWKEATACDLNDGTPERLGCALVDAGFLPALGVTPAIGRNFSMQEDEPGAEPVALISGNLWRSRFGGEMGVLTKRVTIDGVSTRILGVLPDSFETPTLSPADVLLPLKLRKDAQRQRLVQVIGRLRTGLSVEAARAQLNVLFERFVQSAPADFRKAVPMRLRVESVRDRQTRGYRLALWTLLGAVFSFVLIACANVAHLQLARSASRSREFSVRAALGASRRRLAVQALAESALLGGAGGAAGCLLAYALLRVFQFLAPHGVSRINQVALDLRVIAFAAGLSLAAVLAFGLVPALARLDGEAWTVTRIAGRRNDRLRPALVCLQMSISILLLTATTAFVMNLWRLQQIRLGFVPQNVVTATFILPEQRYATGERQIAFFQDLEQKLNRVPGFASAAITDSLPPGGDPRSFPFVALIGGGDAEEEGLEGLVKWRYVTTGYFETLGIPIRRGRSFTEADRSASYQTAVVSELLAKRLFGEADPVGRIVRLWGQPCQITGVAADVRNAGLQAAPDAEAYLLRSAAPSFVFRNQRPPLGWRLATAVARSAAPNHAAAEALQETIRQVDPSIAVVSGALDSEVSRLLAPPRFQTALLGLFATIGLVLAGIGLYGLTSFLVAERTREIGIRIALGATPTQVVRTVMKEGMVWTSAGVGIGLLASMFLMRSLAALLYRAEALDIRIFGTAVAVLVIVALAGSWIPGARATRIDPMKALRHE